MSDSVRHVIDSAVQFKVDSIMLSKTDLITKIDSFYNNAWDKLVIYGSISVALIGIVVPYIIQWYQRKELRLQETELTKKLQEHASGIFKKEADELKKVVKDRIKTGLAASKAISFHLLGNNATTPKDAAVNYLVAISHYLIAGEYVNLRNTLDLFNDKINGLTSQDIKDIEIDAAVPISKLFKELSEDNINAALQDVVGDTRKTLSRIGYQLTT